MKTTNSPTTSYVPTPSTATFPTTIYVTYEQQASTGDAYLRIQDQDAEPPFEDVKETAPCAVYELVSVGQVVVDRWFEGETIPGEGPGDGGGDGDLSVGQLPVFPSHSPGPPDDASEPMYDRTTDTLIHVGDSSMSYYDDATSWGALVDPQVPRFYPRPSPIGGTGASASVTPTLVDGIDGGKAMSIAYVGDAHEDPQVILMQCPMNPGDEGIIQCYMKIGGSLSIDSYLTSKFILAWGTETGRWQWALHDPYPPKDWYPSPDISNGRATIIFPTGPVAAEDDNFDPPDGRDYGVQKRGPYLHELNDGNWHRFTAWFRSHNPDNVTKDGGMRLWIDGVKVQDLSQSAIGVEVPGTSYPWCTQNMQEIQFHHNEGISGGDRSLSFGADASGSTTPWQEIINIGDGDVDNPHTFKFFSRPRT